MTGTLAAHYRRLRPQIGKVHSAELGVVTRRDLERFAIASHAPRDPSPGGDAATAPPLFLSSVMGWDSGPAEGELDGDGTAPADTRGLRLTGVRLMGAGQELEFHAPVRDGTRVLAHTSLCNVELKEGRSGALLLLHIERRFTDDHGQALVTCNETFIAR